MKIFREKAGVISEGPVWVCKYSCYLHASRSLLALIWNVLTEYKHDRHIVG